jgi:hypothetical protein
MKQAARKLLGLLFNLKIAVTYSSETSVGFEQTTWCYIPEDRSLQNHCCQNNFIIALFAQQHIRARGRGEKERKKKKERKEKKRRFCPTPCVL